MGNLFPVHYFPTQAPQVDLANLPGEKQDTDLLAMALEGI